MKVRIWKDERYPDYGISTNEPNPVEIPDDLYARYSQVSKDYDAVQDELEKLYKAQL